MGAEPWDYVTEYREDADEVLQKLRCQEFESGRYEGGGEEGPLHDSIEEAMEDADADGTCSILDIERASPIPDSTPEELDCGTAYPLPQDKLTELFGTDKPPLQSVRGSFKLYDLIGRGSCIYVVFYEEDKNEPAGIYWAGYSYD